MKKWVPVVLQYLVLRYSHLFFVELRRFRTSKNDTILSSQWHLIVFFLWCMQHLAFLNIGLYSFWSCQKMNPILFDRGQTLHELGVYKIVKTLEIAGKCNWSRCKDWYTSISSQLIIMPLGLMAFQTTLNCMFTLNYEAGVIFLKFVSLICPVRQMFPLAIL